MRKAVSYLRVSSKEQKEEGFSIPAQRKLLQGFAKQNQYEPLSIAKEFEDDETAKSSGRDGFGEMVEFIKQNNIEVILVEKTDRLYRNFKDYVTIDELGVTVYLVKENEVIGKDASSHQKFIHGIKVLMAKNYVDNLSEEVKKGLEQKAEQGIFPCSTPPLGYKMGTINGKSAPVPDELNRELAVKMFEYFATGMYSLKSLIEKVHTEGLVKPENFPKGSKLTRISTSSAQRILKNPLYYGDFYWKDKHYHRGIHEPLIDKNLWDRVQQVFEKKNQNTSLPKYGKKHFDFKGIFTCGECGRTITAERKIKPSGKSYAYYRCTKYGNNCTQKAVSETILHKQVYDALEGLTIPDETFQYVSLGLKQSLHVKRNTTDKARDNLEEKRSVFLKRLDALYEDKLDGNINQSFYERKFSEYTSQIEDLEQQLYRYTKADFDYYRLGSSILELCQKAAFLYKKANPQEKRELLGFLLSDSKIKDKQAQISYKTPFNKVFCYTKNTPADAEVLIWRTGRESNRRGGEGRRGQRQRE